MGKETRLDIHEARKLRTEVLKTPGVKQGYVQYSGTPDNHMVLDAKSVQDRIRLENGYMPINPIIFRSLRHYAFVGRVDAIIKMLMEGIKAGYPFRVIGLRQDSVDDDQYEHRNVLFDVSRYAPAPRVRDSLAGAYCWILSPASPASLSALSANLAHTAGVISHTTEVSAHASLHIAESSHHGLHSAHGIFRMEMSKKEKAIYQLGKVEQWILNKSKPMKYSLAGRKKIQIDIGCEIAATNKTTAPYDSQKKSTPDAPLEISVELLCLSIYFMMTGKKPSSAFSQPFLDAVKVFVLTDTIPDYLALRKEILPLTVMQDTDNECYLASVLSFFHKTRAISPLTVSEEWELEREALSKKNKQKAETCGDTHISRYAHGTTHFIKDEALYKLDHGIETFIHIGKEKEAFIKGKMRSQLDELMIYVKTGNLSEQLQSQVDEIGCPHAKLVDDVNDTYQKACEFLYYMKRDKLPEALDTEQLDAFKDYTKSGIEPEFFTHRPPQVTPV